MLRHTRLIKSLQRRSILNLFQRTRRRLQLHSSKTMAPCQLHLSLSWMKVTWWLREFRIRSILDPTCLSDHQSALPLWLEIKSSRSTSRTELYSQQRLHVLFVICSVILLDWVVERWNFVQKLNLRILDEVTFKLRPSSLQQWSMKKRIATIIFIERCSSDQTLLRVDSSRVQCWEGWITMLSQKACKA